MKEIVREDKCSEPTLIMGDVFTWISHITQTRNVKLSRTFYQIMYSSDNQSHLGLHRRSTGSRHTHRHHNYLLARATPTWSLFISGCDDIKSLGVTGLSIVGAWQRQRDTDPEEWQRLTSTERERSQGPHAACVLSRCLAWVIDIVSIITLLCSTSICFMNREERFNFKWEMFIYVYFKCLSSKSCLCCHPLSFDSQS